MMKSTAVALAAMLLPSLALSATMAADESAGAEPEMVVAQGPTVRRSPRPRPCVGSSTASMNATTRSRYGCLLRQSNNCGSRTA